MLKQIQYFSEDVKRMLGKHRSRILYIWFGRQFCGILAYRIDRGLFELIGRPYRFVRIPLLPLLNLMQAYANIDISYKADIKGGILLLHTAVGVVISPYAVIGKNLTLTGGNVIGSRGNAKAGDIAMGDFCNLGANAVVLGPMKLGNRIKIGACACVVKDCLIDGTSLVGVPAKPVN